MSYAELIKTSEVYEKERYWIDIDIVFFVFYSCSLVCFDSVEDDAIFYSGSKISLKDSEGIRKR